jgi:hypothetical protein
MPWRAQKSSIVEMTGGLALGEPEIDFCAMISANAKTGIGSSVAPTRCSRPFGASVSMMAYQSSDTFTVEITKLREPAIFFIAAESRELTTACAPSPSASSRLESLEVNAVTSHPHLFRN